MAFGVDWLKEHFSVDLTGYDLVRGYRADDSYFSFARAFLSNTIPLSTLSEAMRLGNLGEQVVAQVLGKARRGTRAGEAAETAAAQRDQCKSDHQKADRQDVGRKVEVLTLFLNTVDQHGGGDVRQRRFDHVPHDHQAQRDDGRALILPDTFQQAKKHGVPFRAHARGAPFPIR